MYILTIFECTVQGIKNIHIVVQTFPTIHLQSFSIFSDCPPPAPAAHPLLCP